MTTPPNFDKGSPEPEPYGQPYGQPAGYAQPGGFGQPGAPGSPYGSPAPYGTSGSVVGPDGEWLGPPLASWGLRLVGYLVDTVIAGLFGFVVGLVLALIGADAAGLPQALNVIVLVVYGYLNGALGQTPGKKLVGIKLLRVTDGQVIGAGAGIGRQFLHILDALPLLLGFLWPIWDKKNQTFADKIIGSVVIKA